MSKKDILFQAKDKTVQKITKDGLVQENLTQGTTKRISVREEDVSFSHKGTKSVDAVRLAKTAHDVHISNKRAKKAKQYDKARLRFSEQDKAENTGEAAAPNPDSSASDNASAAGEKSLKKVEKAGGKAEKVDSKLEKARKKQPHKKKLKSKLEFDEASGKAKYKLYFEDEAKPVKHPGAINRGAKAAVRSGVFYAHKKIHQVEGENVGVEAAHKSEKAVENTARAFNRHSNRKRLKNQKRITKLEKRSLKAHVRLQYQKNLHENPQLKNANPLNKFFQKQRIKRNYIKSAKKAGQGMAASKKAGRAANKVGSKIAGFFKRHSHLFGSILAILLLLVLLSTMISSCSLMLGQSVTTVFASSYLSDPEEIEAAELYYTELEVALQQEINRIKAENPGYDDYRYQIGAIQHDPFVLIGYLSAKYTDFTFHEVKPELDSLFASQYGLSLQADTEVRTETRTIQVGESLGAVVTSGYCNCVICCGSWSGGPTASGAMPKGKHTIAVDAANPIVPMGTKVVMNGIEYTVEDTGNFARYGVAFDVYYDNHAEASAHGHKTWEAFLAEGNSNSVEVTTETEVTILSTTLETNSLSGLVSSRLNEEQKEIYSLYNSSKGNLQTFASPLELNWYYLVSSYYGYRVNQSSGNKQLHQGIDIAVSLGTQVMAMHTGTVTTVAYDSHFGNYIVISDEKGYQSKYAHLGSVNVSQGQTVTVGDVIGTTGSTGASTGSHLHLEVLYDNTHYNPIFYVTSGSGTLYGDGGMAYDDETFAKIMAEATKYIGYPYVWGGSSPSTSFDCSGFVSWVYTRSGVYNIGRDTAQGIYNRCTPIDASEARPGDLIFFTGTYNSGTPVTHIGIYVGDGTMLHCGNPIGYANINSSYWSSHFYSFGRLSGTN